MRKSKRTLTLATIFVAAIVGASMVYAHDGREPSSSMMRGGMMGEGMMGQMSQMMDHCSTMMQAGPRGRRPNDQWRKDSPPKPDTPAKPDKEG